MMGHTPSPIAMHSSARSLHAYLSHLMDTRRSCQRWRYDSHALLRAFLDDPRNSPNDAFGRGPDPYNWQELTYFEAWIRTHDVDGPTMAMFLAHGADPLAGGEGLSVAFRIMKGSDDPEPIIMLLDAGLPLDCEWGHHGWTLFHQAASFHSQERSSRILPVLVDRAIQAGRQDLLQAISRERVEDLGQTPMDVALMGWHWASIRLLAKHVPVTENVRRAAVAKGVTL